MPVSFDSTVPTGSGSYLNFASESFKKSTNSRQVAYYQFYALCGDNPPTITQGYGKWNVIDRPLRQGITIPTGFDPAKLHIEIKFGIWDGRFATNKNNPYAHDGWDTSADAASQVETDIDALHWMAGGNFEAGPSPVVYVWAGTRRHQTRLVPKQYWNVPWIISGGINWGQSWRHSNGDRIYQEANFDLLGYSSIGVPAPKLKSKTAGKFFHVDAAHRTAFSIASANSSHESASAIESLARQILANKRNNPCRGSRIKLERRGLHWPIPIGTLVWIPEHQL